MSPEQQRKARAVVGRLQEELPHCALMLIAMDAREDPPFDDSLTRVLRRLADRLEDRLEAKADT